MAAVGAVSAKGRRRCHYEARESQIRAIETRDIFADFWELLGAFDIDITATN